MIGSVTKVLSRNISIKSFKFTGIFDPSKSPPTSDIYTSCVTDTQATINFVISLVIVLAVLILLYMIEQKSNNKKIQRSKIREQYEKEERK